MIFNSTSGFGVALVVAGCALAAFIPFDPEDNRTARATEEHPGGWRGFISYTLQGDAYGIQAKPPAAPTNFWEPGCGANIRTINENDAGAHRAASR